MKVYLYLVKTNKTDVKILNVSEGDFCQPTIITDFSKLPENIKNIAFEKRIDWDVYLESANNYEELKIKLRNRGYKNVPAYNSVTQNQKIKYDIKPVKTMLKKLNSSNIVS